MLRQFSRKPIKLLTGKMEGNNEWQQGVATQIESSKLMKLNGQGVPFVSETMRPRYINKKNFK